MEVINCQVSYTKSRHTWDIKERVERALKMVGIKNEFDVEVNFVELPEPKKQQNRPRLMTIEEIREAEKKRHKEREEWRNDPEGPGYEPI